MKKIKRRKFLAVSATGALGVMAAPFVKVGRAFGGNGPDGPPPVLVTVYLRGGLDQLNVVVPYADSNYYKIRPTIAIPREGEEGDPGVIQLDRRFGLHPSLAALKPFYDEKRFAPIVNAGSAHPTRSHFDAQDFMEYAAPGSRTVKDGWLNRYLSATAARDRSESGLRALAMQGLLPRSLRGRYPVLAVPESVNQKKGDEVLEMFKDLYGCQKTGGRAKMGGAGDMASGRRAEDAVVATGRNTIQTLEKFKAIIREPAAAGAQASYPRGRLADRLGNIARVIRSDAGLEVAAIDIGGWDHHTGEGGNDGLLARMLKGLGDALAAFMTDLGPDLDRTLVFVMSEFGRTCRENGNAGTDHGHGGLFLLMGGKVRGGKVHGKWPGLDEKRMYQGRDLQVTTDFRDVFSDVLQHHLRFKPPKGFFPDYKPGRVAGLF